MAGIVTGAMLGSLSTSGARFRASPSRDSCSVVLITGCGVAVALIVFGCIFAGAGLSKRLSSFQDFS